MAANDGMVRKVGWSLVSQREKVFSCGTAVSGWCKVQVRIAEHVLSIWTRGLRMMVVIRVVNSKQPKIRYGKKAALRTSYGF